MIKPRVNIGFAFGCMIESYVYVCWVRLRLCGHYHARRAARWLGIARPGQMKSMFFGFTLLALIVTNRDFGAASEIGWSEFLPFECLLDRVSASIQAWRKVALSKP